MIDIRFKPLAKWPETSTPADNRRGSSTFKASYEDTLSKLSYEVAAVGGDYIIIELGVGPNDIRIDGWPKAYVAPDHPGVIVSFESHHGPLRYMTDICERWQHNLRSIALGLEALRAVDRYGISSRGEQYRGWAELPVGTPLGEHQAESEMTAESAANILAGWLSDSTNLAENAQMVIANRTYRQFCYREIAKALHPDTNPADADVFKRVTTARDFLERHAPAS